MSLQQAATATGGCLTGTNTHFSHVVTDSRESVRDGLFVALRGPSFDGHEYAGKAMADGAAACMLEYYLPDISPAIQVGSCLEGLGRLAADWRRRIPAKVCAVTGSNGKTTVKEMLAAILRQRACVTSTLGNRNNDIGMPLTLLQVTPKDRYAVVEMGMNHPGEIARLSQLAAPDVAIITNAAPAHLESLGTVDTVAAAKAEIFQGLSEQGVAVINSDSPYAHYWRQQAKGHQLLLFGNSTDADVCAVDGPDQQWQLQIEQDRAPVRLQVPGRHNRCNALAAAAAAHALGMEIADIASGLAACQAVPGRMQLRSTCSGAQLYDDSYNANPQSLRVALEVMASYPGKRILVLGDMAELGTQSAVLHADCGQMAADFGIDLLFGLGSRVRNTCRVFGEAAMAFDDVASLLSALRPQLDASTLVLVKGSRCMHMEAVVAALCEPAKTTGVASC